MGVGHDVMGVGHDVMGVGYDVMGGMEAGARSLERNPSAVFTTLDAGGILVVRSLRAGNESSWITLSIERIQRGWTRR